MRVGYLTLSSFIIYCFSSTAVPLLLLFIQTGHLLSAKLIAS